MSPTSIPQPHRFAANLLAWYARGHREMPWRSPSLTPYHIWLAEIMLQQTTVTAVIPYYQRFLARFPTVQSLAEAPIDDVLAHWQGLGYYRRAHLLYKCAQTIVNNFNGQFPATEAELLTLPGLGPYTAAVIAATAFNQPANVVDGNVERVISRVFRIAAPLPASKPQIRAAAATLASPSQPRLYANAIMELGSQICTPTNPQCVFCPVAEDCQAFAHRDQLSYPVKTPKKASPHHTASAWIITDTDGHLFLQQRPASGLLASLWELPHSGWEPHFHKSGTIQQPPLPLGPTKPVGTHTHTFTHFKLTLNLHHAVVPAIPVANRIPLGNLPPLSTLMRKAIEVAYAAIQTSS